MDGLLRIFYRRGIANSGIGSAIEVIAIGARHVRKIADEIADVDIFKAFITGNRELATDVEIAFEGFEAVSVEFWVSFADCAVAGDEFLVGEAIVVGGVDVAEFLADLVEEGAFVVSGDADLDFAVVVGFDDFGVGVAVVQDNAVAPDETLVSIDQAIHADDEGGDQSFGHKVVAIGEGKAVGEVEGAVVGGDDGEELRGDVGAESADEGIAEVDLFHEFEEFVLDFGVLGGAPEVLEILGGEAAVLGEDDLVFDDFVDGVCDPFGFEDDVVF